MPHIARVMNRNVETNLARGASLGRLLISREHAQMTASQLKGTPKTLPNGEEVLVPDQGQRSHPGAIPLLGSSNARVLGLNRPELRVVRAQHCNLRP